MGILTDKITDEMLERMMAQSPQDFDITEAMMRRITSLEIMVMQLEGYILAIEFRLRKKIV